MSPVLNHDRICSGGQIVEIPLPHRRPTNPELAGLGVNVVASYEASFEVRKKYADADLVNVVVCL
jgi:hypothetical protein